MVGIYNLKSKILGRNEVKRPVLGKLRTFPFEMGIGEKDE